jgi:integrase
VASYCRFSLLGHSLRETTALEDNAQNRKLEKAIERMEAEILLGTFEYENTFQKVLV